MLFTAGPIKKVPASGGTRYLLLVHDALAKHEEARFEFHKEVSCLYPVDLPLSLWLCCVWLSVASQRRQQALSNVECDASIKRAVL